MVGAYKDLFKVYTAGIAGCCTRISPEYGAGHDLFDACRPVVDTPGALFFLRQPAGNLLLLGGCLYFVYHLPGGNDADRSSYCIANHQLVGIYLTSQLERAEGSMANVSYRAGTRREHRLYFAACRSAILGVESLSLERCHLPGQPGLFGRCYRVGANYLPQTVP